MKPEDFIEISTTIRVWEKRLLSNADMGRILGVSDVFDTLKQISQSTDYNFLSLTRVEGYENLLKDGMKSMYSALYKICPHEPVIDISAAKYDFLDLKAALKSKYVNNIIPNFSDLPKHLQDAANAVETAFSESGDPQTIDIETDKQMFDYILSLCKGINSELITEYVKLMIDFHNIKTLLRAKNMRLSGSFFGKALLNNGLTDKKFFLEHYGKPLNSLSSAFYYKYFGNMVKDGITAYSKTGNFSLLEKLFDNYLIDHTKKAKYIAFGPEIPFVYILSKENEARQIRVLVTGRNNGFGTEALMERLRDNYA